jgi:hypothetical protein
MKSDDTLWCWGENSNGQLGAGTGDHEQCGIDAYPHDCSSSPLPVVKGW